MASSRTRRFMRALKRGGFDLGPSADSKEVFVQAHERRVRGRDQPRLPPVSPHPGRTPGTARTPSEARSLDAIAALKRRVRNAETRAFFYRKQAERSQGSERRDLEDRAEVEKQKVATYNLEQLREGDTLARLLAEREERRKRRQER